MLTGVKFLIGSYGSLLLVTDGDREIVGDDQERVAVATGALAAVPAPIAPLAPGRFSTKKVWPRRFGHSSARSGARLRRSGRPADTAR